MSKKYFSLVSDDEAVAWIVEEADKPYVEASQIVNGFRQKAREAGVADTVKIHAEVQPGCLFKRDIPQMGPTWDDFKYLQKWSFSDPPTEHALVSWVPRPLASSVNKNVSEQTAVVAAFKTEAGLPAWYKVSFGSVNHIAGLSFAHFKATGEDPFFGLEVRTDTCYANGSSQLELHWFCRRLYCDDWDSDESHMCGLTIFLLGVVKAVER